MDALSSTPVLRTGAKRLTILDYGLLAMVCVALYGATLPFDRTLTCHETVHCQNVREMLASQDWIIPTYGGRPWLERPPLPHWLTALVALPFGAQEHAWPFQLGSMLAGMACVLMTAWMASLWFGRAIGWLGGLSLATMFEFYRYSLYTECDIYLCLVVTAALALFVKLEFGSGRARRAVGAATGRERDPAPLPDGRGSDGKPHAFLGPRPWLVLLFFAIAGLTNAAKGLFFGTFFVALPAAGYLLVNWRWPAMRRYVWLWGWLAFVLTAAAWPLAAYLRYPDILDLWRSDYVGRMNQGYMKEPFWYYFAQLPVITAPWIGFCIIGFVITAKSARQRHTPERFLWCSALIPLAFFSVPQGKHHHYLLHAMAPWAILAGLGTRRAWQWLCERPAWLRHPSTGLAFVGLPGLVALWFLCRRLPGSGSWFLLLMFAWPILVAVLWWAFSQPRPRTALAGLTLVLVGGYFLMFAGREWTHQPFAQDVAFLRRMQDHTHAEKTVFIAADPHPLHASWLLFYAGRPTQILHNPTFLRDDAIEKDTVYVVGRAYLQDELKDFGQTDVIDQSRYTRGEQAPRERYTLFRVHLREDLVRIPASRARITPMQATGRALGPYLQ